MTLSGFNNPRPKPRVLSENCSCLSLFTQNFLAASRGLTFSQRLYRVSAVLQRLWCPPATLAGSFF